MARRLRHPLLALGLAALAAGLWGGLARLGWHPAAGAAREAGLHGPLMVFGFLGTVVSLERAVALGRPWGYAAPAATLAGTALLLAQVGHGIGEAALLAAGVVLAGLLTIVLRARPTLANAVLVLAAALWLVGVALWLGGHPLATAVPWWAAFLVLTIVGERLELAALGRLDRRGSAAFAVLVLLLLAGLALGSAGDGDGGARVVGAAFVGFALWLARYDVARRTVRLPGLPRFAAAALLAGYVWLATGGVLWLRYGAPAFGPHHDAVLHSLFLGFVFSMIFGHAPVVFPALLGRPIPFRRAFYGHLALLHAALAVRVGADLAGSATAARHAGVANAAAIVLFLVATVASGALAARAARRRSAGSPARATSSSGSAGSQQRRHRPGSGPAPAGGARRRGRTGSP